MFKDLINWVKKLFQKNTETTTKETKRNEMFANDYGDDTGVNIEAIVCNKLAGMTEYESVVQVIGENKRAKKLNEVLKRFWKTKFKKLVADTLGNGGMFVIPNYIEGRIIEDVVPQSRVTINKCINGELLDITVVAEKTVLNASRVYYRLTDHTFNNGKYTIKQKAITQEGEEVDLSVIPKWASLTKEYTIGGYDRLPIAYFKAPISSRNLQTNYGVPITYGQKALIQYIKNFIEMFVKEFENKKTFIGVDERLFDDKNNVVDGLFKKLHGDTDTFWQEFSPTIRDVSIINGLDMLFAMLEYGIGTSRGILTKLESIGATATEIKAVQRDTAILINSIRTMCESGIDNLVYGYSAMMEHFGVTPAGEYEISFDWDLSFLESTTETFNQLQIGKSLGVISDERLNMYITGNDEEQAKEELEYIKANQPTLRELGVINEDVE